MKNWVAEGIASDINDFSGDSHFEQFKSRFKFCIWIKRLDKFKFYVRFRLKPHNYSHTKLGAKTHGRPFLWHCQNSICTL